MYVDPQGLAAVLAVVFFLGCWAGRVLTIRMAHRQAARTRRANKVAKANPRR